jgi:hypothetical protein
MSLKMWVLSGRFAFVLLKARGLTKVNDVYWGAIIV